MTVELLREDIRSLACVMHSVGPTLEKTFARALKLLAASLASGGKIFACGNGGSSADADHMIGELLGRFGYDRAPLPGILLSQASAAVTAIGNDYGYEFVFERQVQALGRIGDVLIGISTSGNSPNVLKALEAGKKIGMVTIAMTGAADSKCGAAADITLRAPSRETPRIQEIHAILIHSLCRGIEQRLFPKELPTLPSKKILSSDDFEKFVQAIKPLHSVFTNGCFDILHPGHIDLLQKSRAFGDLLIIGLNTDASVKKLKGSERPFHTFADRANVLAALTAVDYVIGFEEETPVELIRRLTPKVLVKGGDYTKETIVGADWVELHGGEVKVVPLVQGHSTSRILKNA